jgi:sugar phosphate isomerase/epimerase
MLRIGVRAHDFGKLPAEELAARIAAKGLCCVQLAVNRAIAGVELVPGRGDLNAGLAWEIGRAFAGHGVQIAVLGCYINLSQPDPAARGPLVAYFKEHLRQARDFGCGMVATETGSLNADWSFHPGNRGEEAFSALVPVVAELVAEAERFGVVVGIEGVASHVLNSPGRIRRLLDEVGSNNLQVVFDPVNLLSMETYREQERVMKESCDLFGERIAVIHAKDFAVEGGGGRGELHYEVLMEWLRARKPGISILLEEASEGTAEECAGYLRRWE